MTVNRDNRSRFTTMAPQKKNDTFALKVEFREDGARVLVDAGMSKEDLVRKIGRMLPGADVVLNDVDGFIVTEPNYGAANDGTTTLAISILDFLNDVEGYCEDSEDSPLRIETWAKVSPTRRLRWWGVRVVLPFVVLIYMGYLASVMDCMLNFVLLCHGALFDAFKIIHFRLPCLVFVPGQTHNCLYGGWRGKTVKKMCLILAKKDAWDNTLILGKVLTDEAFLALYNAEEEDILNQCNAIIDTVFAEVVNWYWLLFGIMMVLLICGFLCAKGVFGVAMLLRSLASYWGKNAIGTEETGRLSRRRKRSKHA